MRVFADTFYWIALTDSADDAHDRAVQFSGEIVTTDEVLTEYLTFFARRQNSYVAKSPWPLRIFCKTQR